MINSLHPLRNGDDQMVLIHLQNIYYDVNDRRLFHIDELKIHKGDRIGLVGRNGSGKTTLLQLIAGEKTPTSGTVKTNASVALLPQLKPQIEKKSGGESAQAIIHQTLSLNPEILLADEPTTHLDLEHTEKLEQKLKQWRETMVIVSHDRTFLDALCNQIWEIENGKISVYKGNYSQYEQQKEAARSHHKKEYKKYIQKKKQLEEALQLKEQQAQRAVRKPKQVSPKEAKIIGAKPYFAKKQKKLHQSVKAIQKRIEQLDKVEKIKELPPIKMKVVHEDSLRNRMIIRGEQVSGKVGNRLLWREFDFTIAGGDKVALIGPNGSGKTTFLQMLMNGTKEIYVSPAVTFGYFSQTLDVLDVNASIFDNVRKYSPQDQTLIRIVLARLGFFREDVFKPVHVLSGGERVKVALAKLLLSKANVLVLDEPTNYLDIPSVEALESLLKEYSGTVIFASHDRRFLKNIATRIFAINNKQIHSFDGSYQAYIEMKTKKEHHPLQDELLKVDINISEVLSQLSIAPSEELEQKFAKLLEKKKEIEQRLKQQTDYNLE